MTGKGGVNYLEKFLALTCLFAILNARLEGGLENIGGNRWQSIIKNSRFWEPVLWYFVNTFLAYCVWDGIRIELSINWQETVCTQAR